MHSYIHPDDALWLAIAKLQEMRPAAREQEHGRVRGESGKPSMATSDVGRVGQKLRVRYPARAISVVLAQENMAARR